eukprot:COSAG01_NODE_24623_length_772_cov_2.741456_1_plen_87_part_10
MSALRAAGGATPPPAGGEPPPTSTLAAVSDKEVGPAAASPPPPTWFTEAILHPRSGGSAAQVRAHARQEAAHGSTARAPGGVAVGPS